MSKTKRLISVYSIAQMRGAFDAGAEVVFATSGHASREINIEEYNEMTDVDILELFDMLDNEDMETDANIALEDF